MSFDVAAIKANSDIVDIVGRYVQLKQRGREHIGLCPFHDDKNPSFYVVPAKQLCHCFACDASHDVISFLQEIEGIDFKTACERLGGQTDWKPNPIPREKVLPPPDRVTSKPPATASSPDMTIRGLGAPSTAWRYTDAAGDLLGYVARYDTDSGKEIRCWTWGAKGDTEPRWGCGHWSKPRPLYGLHRLAQQPTAPVLIVEGEKAADAAQLLLPHYAVITWPGGAKAWKHADWAPLRGRRCDLWPDNDEAGVGAMRALQAILEDKNGLSCHGKFIEPAGMEEGFDAADWEPGADIMPWLRGRATDYPEPPVEAQAVSAPQPPQPEVGAPPFTPADPAPIPPDDGPPLEAYADDASQHDDGDEPDDDAVPMSEDMLAGRFMDEHAANWRYVKLWNAWYEWRGDGWYVDDTGRISELARLLVRSSQFWAEARSFTPLQLRAMNQKRTCWNVRDLAQTDARVTAKVDQWDRDSWLLGIPGGVIDLKTGETLKASRDQYITKRAAVAPEEGEPAIWTAFLRRITGDDESLMEYLQRFAGYSLTGETSEHALAFLYGTGANGKTTFLHTLSKILGDYAISAGFEVLAESKGDRHPTEIARLRGARLVVTEETDAGGRWNEGRVKRLTGGGKISAHFMRQDDFEFEPQFKLLIAGNHKPVIRAVDEAIKRRIHLIPFTVTIPAEERDKTLMDRLKPEWPRILNWALRGCILWQERSLSPGERIIEATNEYVEQEDILGAWLDENCEREGEADGRLLYENYRKWCDSQGENAWSRRGWGAAMLERGFPQRKTRGQRWFVGVHAKLGSSLP